MEINAYLNGIGTEQVNTDSRSLDQLTGIQIARLMNRQDLLVVEAVEKALPAIGQVIDMTAERMKKGGHLYYCGAGTSGRLGVLDASECPPTFGVSPDLVCGVIAGGDQALRHAIEGAEDSYDGGQEDIRSLAAGALDTVVAISASGYAPYCAGALDYARSVGAVAVSMTCNLGSALSEHADIAIEAPTGAEILMGSTRLKAGTATKMMLNMLSTGVMVRTGRVYQNLMVDLKVSNSKLKDRALRIMRHATGLEPEAAAPLLDAARGKVKTAIVMAMADVNAEMAEAALARHDGWVAPAIEDIRG